MFSPTKEHSRNLSSLTEREKLHYSPAVHVKLTLKRDDACVCKTELLRSHEQPRSLRTPPLKARKQKSLCVRTKNIFTNVYLPERGSNTCGELG